MAKYPLYDVEKASSKLKVPDRPVGVIGLKTSSGKIEEEFLDNLQWPDAGKVYQEMAYNDATVGACLYVIETLVRKANWHAVPAGKEPADTEAAQFLEQCMFDMNEPWDDFICEVLSMLVYGFSFHEIVYKTRRGPLEKDARFRSQYSDGKIGWQALPVRSQASLDRWIVDEKTGEILAFYQDPSIVNLGADPKEIPLEGNLLFKTKASRGNPEGWSILRRAYRSWYFKRYIEELEGIGIERNLAGIPVLQPDENTPLFDKDNDEMVSLLAWATELVDGLRNDRNHGVIIPYGWTLKLLGNEGSSKAPDTDTVIRRYENRIAMTMLADVVMMGGDRTGSFALAETKQGLLLASLQSIIGVIADTINKQAVPRLFAANNMQLENLPKVAADDIMPVSLSDAALILRTMKLDITRNRELFNFLLHMIQGPELSEEDFAQLIADQPADTGSTEEGDDGRIQDPADNAFKQSDKNYS